MSLSSFLPVKWSSRAVKKSYTVIIQLHDWNVLILFPSKFSCVQSFTQRSRPGPSDRPPTGEKPPWQRSQGLQFRKKNIPHKSPCPRSHQQRPGVRVSASFRMWKNSRLFGISIRDKITYFPSNPDESGTTINDIYSILYLTFKITLWFVNLFQASEKWKHLLTVFWWGGCYTSIHIQGCPNANPLLFPHAPHSFYECFPHIIHANEKLNVDKTCSWVCNLIKLSSSAIYF